MNKKNVMPPLVLTIISAVVCGLLVLAYNLTYVDNSGVLTDKLKEKANEIYPNGDFSLVTTQDDEGKTISLTYGDVVNVINDKNSGDYLFEVITDGYNSKGIDVLVGVSEDGEVTGVNFVAISETKGVGTKVDNSDFLSSFIGSSNNDSIDTVDAVSNATYSSNGVKLAVKTAINTYNENKDEIKYYNENEEVTDE